MTKIQTSSIDGNLKATVVILSGQKWDQGKKTMTWNYVDFTNTEIRGEIIEAFNIDNTININVVMKDKKGNKLLRISSKETKSKL